MSTSKFIVRGINHSGKKFRPSDWVERLAGCAAVRDQRHRLVWSEELRPAYVDESKCLLVDSQLQRHAPETWNYVMQFIHSNDLQITELHNPDTPHGHDFHDLQAA